MGPGRKPLTNRTVTQTFRITKEIYDCLRETAREDGRSLNNFVDWVLKGYVDTRFLSVLRIIKMPSRPHLSTILEHISDEELEEIGKTLGQSDPKEYLTLFGLSLNSASFHKALVYISQGTSWFDINSTQSSTPVTYHLRHGMGWKWSKFLRGYLSAFAKELGLRLDVDISELSVIVKPKMDSRPPFV